MFGPGESQKEQQFEDTAFKLEVGEIGSLVETTDGVHMILRTA